MGISRRVLVVGGGIAGLAAALRLASSGADVTVVEQAPEFAEIGAGLQLGPNATRLLDDWGLLERIRTTAVAPRGLVMRDIRTDEVIARQDLGVRFIERYQAPYLVTHRTDLHAVLLDAARTRGARLVPGTYIEEIVQRDDHVVAVSAAGRHFTAGAVIAADGLKSAQRMRLVGDEPQPSGYVAYRGTVPIEQVPTAENLHDVACWVGPRCHIVRYPLRGGRLLNQVAVFHAPRPFTDRVLTGDRAELDEAFSMAHPDVRAGLEFVSTDRCWALADRLPTRRWVDGRLLLVGDAAHPMFQYLAQGACQALEDAAELGDVVAAGLPWRDDSWSAALQEVARRREPRTSWVQTTARAFGEVCHADGVGATRRDAYLRNKNGEFFDELDWLYRAPGEDSRPVDRQPARTAAGTNER
ncbi:FAD-dependent oxidoreductase [Cellulomonas fimi]|uniref:FAD dependent oxidoreductase n=2 Tax=Cellulomonas fimi TaxID=1708 RepID=F4GYK9_CELFA|nr:FAD-dependent oxidoreductase [Cellulomonas fimi]AEE47126.1 FAD dependent oxidoreductase [Cellulomonas fimi ATCC 484]VEH35328.1 3-hydroxybenzoate 6-hydroxylase [Cellulomonas fimi]